jgi:hypothetical protein
MNVLRQAFKQFSDAVGVAWQTISTLIGWLAQVWNTISHNKNVISGFTAVWRFFGDAVHVVVDAFKWLLSNVGHVIDMLSHLKLPDITGITNLIPHFASGGIVDRPTVALLGEGGEREYVIPESKMHQAQTSPPGFTIRGVSEREILDMVDRGLYFKLTRTGGGIGV